MKIHHLNCGSMCPLGRRLINGHGGWLAKADMCCHCLLIETRQGLVLVDTGLGMQDILRPQRLGLAFNGVTRPKLLKEETALHQIQALGFAAEDVRHIVVTHLDLDHAGGLADFPHAQVHVSAREHEAAMQRITLAEKGRYVPDQWAHGPQWTTHTPTGDRWMGFEAIQALPYTDDEVLLVPLTGHTRGHCGVAVKGPEGWLLHCGDAYFFRGEIDMPPTCPWGLKVFQQLVQVNGHERLANQQRLRELQRDHGHDVTLFCAHDAVSLSQLAAAKNTSLKPQ